MGPLEDDDRETRSLEWDRDAPRVMPDQYRKTVTAVCPATTRRTDQGCDEVGRLDRVVTTSTRKRLGKALSCTAW